MYIRLYLCNIFFKKYFFKNIYIFYLSDLTQGKRKIIYLINFHTLEISIPIYIEGVAGPRQ